MKHFNKVNAQFTAYTGIKFSNPSLLCQALTHTSFAYEYDLDYDYERLEFLGDAVLELVISEELFRRFPQYSEGQLTRLRANIVRQKSLVAIARKLKLNNIVLLGRGEKMAGGEERSSLLADVLEAIIGAIYLDSGMDQAKKFILNNFSGVFDVKSQIMPDDYKTRLQEVLQRDMNNVNISYRLLSSEGPDHDKIFHVGLYVNDEYKTRGSGKSKKAAEQKAAGEMLAYLQRLNGK